MSGSGFGEFYSALVGDAAHPARPSFGQGANMALEDAVQLGLVLREASSVRALSLSLRAVVPRLLFCRA